MSKPQAITDLWQLEGRLIYALIVAGKSAKFAAEATARVLERVRDHESPFDMVRRVAREGLMGLRSVLRLARTGNYNRIARALFNVAKAGLDRRTVTPEELERFHGIGPKTARFFITWTRPAERYAVLDVHILRWLRDQGYDPPKSTPTGRRYRQLEEAFLTEADMRGKRPSELDAEIWRAGSRRRRGKGTA